MYVLKVDEYVNLRKIALAESMNKFRGSKFSNAFSAAMGAVRMTLVILMMHSNCILGSWRCTVTNRHLDHQTIYANEFIGLTMAIYI